MPNFVKILEKYEKGNIQTNKQTATLSVHLRNSREGMKLNASQELERHSEKKSTPLLVR
jgi:hypothetical protein